MFSSITPTIPVASGRLYWDQLMGTVKENFPRNLDFLLGKKRGLAKKLAERMDLPASTISRWRRGTLSPDIDQIDDIAKSLGETPERLLLTDLTGDKAKSADDPWAEMRAVLAEAGLKVVKDS